ncbi:MAG: hypothetical protein MK235_00225 [Candidatus Poseidoniales archaeon]|nr:hypothetical protein [Candidatus Poseidoniales archaeon]
MAGDGLGLSMDWIYIVVGLGVLLSLWYWVSKREKEPEVESEPFRHRVSAEAEQRYLEQVKDIRPGLALRDMSRPEDSVDASGRAFLKSNPEARARYDAQVKELIGGEE